MMSQSHALTERRGPERSNRSSNKEETDDRSGFAREDPGSRFESPAGGVGSTRLSKDVIFELLSVERRRQVLANLRESGGGTTLSTLATRIAAEENGVAVDALSSQQRKRVYIALYQTHLPKMDDAGVIEFDRHRGTIELSGDAGVLYSYLDLDPAHRDIETGPDGVLDRIGGWLARVARR